DMTGMTSMTGWADGLRMILDNLLDNAAVHGADGTGAGGGTDADRPRRPVHRPAAVTRFSQSSLLTSVSGPTNRRGFVVRKGSAIALAIVLLLLSLAGCRPRPVAAPAPTDPGSATSAPVGESEQSLQISGLTRTLRI